MDLKNRKKYAILDILSNSTEPLSSISITTILTAQGVDISERSVRLYLKEFDAAGYTVNVERKGRMITAAGSQECQKSRVLERVGYLSSKIDAMSYKMNFDLDTCEGTVLADVSVVPLTEFTVFRRKMFAAVFAKKYAMGKKLALFPPNSMCMGTVIPSKHVGIVTICSITFNGILRSLGIPVFSRFGGLLEIRDDKPMRFTELTNYDSTSIDPLAVFIRAGMADYLGAINKGHGLIGASMREFPAESVSVVREITGRLVELGLGNFICIGNPGQSIFDFQISPESAGAIVIGGLNPISVFIETGLMVTSVTVAGAIPYRDLFPYTQLNERLDQISRIHL
ncbi:MAG: DUF128 domain-containing protein [Deltaproteobacteria bacterium]|nr:DUF128 domain-containing protein [Deltaproteobacteria bacterium]MBN2672022.1 DUF128 domain-containing protein [Deltaproteobacteria bacterium]